MKKYALLTAMALGLTITSNAKVWRVNNNLGAAADFTEIYLADVDANVVSGDTIYVEPSATNYTAFALTKQLVFIGNGFLLDGTANGNTGLQENENASSLGWFLGSITLNAGSEGSKFFGLTFVEKIEFNTIANAANIQIERCSFLGQYVLSGNGTSYTNISLRKCYLTSTSYSTSYVFNSGIALGNFVFENCVVNGTVDVTIDAASTGVVIRNNTILDGLLANNAYVANNVIMGYGTFASCVIKNNLFVNAQTGVTVGPLSTNGNNLINQTLASLIVNTGSDDAKYQLTAASPAIGGGVDISGVKPDCGAFGGSDPYVLSGIPNIPTIYSLSFPNGNSVPSGSTSILVDFSTRNNK